MPVHGSLNVKHMQEKPSQVPALLLSLQQLATRAWLRPALHCLQGKDYWLLALNLLLVQMDLSKTF